MMSVYKLLSLLLDYPRDELKKHLPEIRAALAQSDASDDERDLVDRFLGWLERIDLIDLQAEYVATFDLDARHSLHLTHHILGDDKNRGPALIDMDEYYRAYGLEPISGELPDYLPLMLEFAATLETTEARLFLSHVRKVLTMLAANLEETASPWAPLVRLVENRATLAPVSA
ncbi:nitrate reductase molybdenum cofactor assembly chaperone [Sulfuricystis multivorans]|uniref:nitrate reductase molybdenum cofactor assembly chaperone n=1 Tax=Sulfuricystis multivorans TaxID=2211108 RepID=UPI0024E01223|nr:nitrate reductase molybdenum cofactor assembly chaperone [Sulfuricystis multivorans]